MIISNEELKNILISKNIIEESTWNEIEKEAKKLNISPMNLIISRRFVDKDYLANLISEYLGFERAILKGVSIPANVLKYVPEQIAISRKLIPLKESENQLFVAMANPRDQESISLLSNITNKKIVPMFALEDEIQRAFVNYQALYREKYQQLLNKELSETLKTVTTEEEKALSSARLVDNLLNYAMGLNASDIHIEVFNDYSLVRFRVDGVLREIMKLPKDLHSSIIARIKVLSKLQLDEHFRPQDGRFRTKLGDFEFDIRVSIVPTMYGEKAVLRLLAAQFRPTSLAELGMDEEMQNLMEKAMSKTYGMILSTGPTGSGKTTTLYTILQLLNKPEVNICTIEDPIEYELERINQIQVNPVVNLTFASGLRALLRQDPNIIMVGEIRDFETADIAVQAALTGHLILSTLHTNDAPTAIPRLIDLNIPPYLVASTLTLVMAQRLVRKICINCIYTEELKEPQKIMILEQLKNSGLTDEEIANFEMPKYFYKGKGCEYCSYSGYTGRTGIFEMFFVDDEIADYLSRKDFSLVVFKDILKKKGFRTMFQDGLNKAIAGLTTLEEVLRVIKE